MVICDSTSNVSRGKRQKEGPDGAIPCILEPQGNEKACRKSWSRLIQKIYETDPQVCPRCNGTMRIISSIEDPSVIRDFLNHLGLWLTRAPYASAIEKQCLIKEATAPFRIFCKKFPYRHFFDLPEMLFKLIPDSTLG